MHLDLSDEETAALTKELHDIIESDRYPFSPRIRTLTTILTKLDLPAPRPEPPPPLNVGAAPDVGAAGGDVESAGLSRNRGK
jgi:hypothetical protein